MAESVLHQQFTKVTELRVVVARRGPGEIRAGSLEVVIRGVVAAAFLQKSLNFRVYRDGYRLGFRRRITGRYLDAYRDTCCGSQGHHYDQDRKHLPRDLPDRGHILPHWHREACASRLPTYGRSYVSLGLSLGRDNPGRRRRPRLTAFQPV